MEIHGVTLARKAVLKYADELDEMARQGSETDEPEGSRTVVVSDTLLIEIAKNLREMVAQ